MRLAFLHGFTQTHHHWHRIASAIVARLGGDHTLVFPDLPGHGLSADDRSGIDATAAALARTLGSSVAVGYSMGGRVALRTALAPGNRIERLVLIGATPGLDEPDARTARVAADEQLVARIESVGVDAFVDEWLAAPLFATLPPDPRGLEWRRRNTADGLAHSLRTAGTGAQTSLWGRMGEIDIPVLALAGELDRKFTSIGRAMVERLPNATFTTVPGAGHAAHTERPDDVANLIVTWLTSGPPISL